MTEMKKTLVLEIRLVFTDYTEHYSIPKAFLENGIPNLCLLQGLMFGYATDETEECMPLTLIMAHKLNAKLAELRRNGTLPWLRPDSKTQVNGLLV